VTLGRGGTWLSLGWMGGRIGYLNHEHSIMNKKKSSKHLRMGPELGS
jgi:hypothetical protein